MPDYAAACEAKILEALEGAISIEELHDEMLAISDAIELARAKGEDVHSAAGRLSNDLVRSAERSALIEKRNAYKAVLVDKEAKTKVDLVYEHKKGSKDSLFLGIESTINGINAPLPGAQRSAAATGQALEAEFQAALFSRLDKAGLDAAFSRGMKGDFELQVGAAIRHLNTKDATGETPRIGNLGSRSYQDAVAIAKIIVDLQEAMRLRLNRAGADIPRLSGFMGHQTHNEAKMLLAGFDKWKASISGILDWDKMKIPHARRDQFLKDAYDSIVTGTRKDPKTAGEPLAEAFKGPANIARSLSHSRLFHFKEAGDWLAYNKKFGSGSLKESIINDISMSAKNIGVMERLTANPELELQKLITETKQRYKSIDPTAVNYLKSKEKALWNRFDTVTGAINTDAGGMTIGKLNVASVSNDVRAAKNMAVLGSSVIPAMSDIGFGATNRIYHGRSLLQAWGDGFLAPIMGLSGKERKQVATLAGAGMEGRVGSAISRFSTDDMVTGTMSKMQTFFFKANLLTPWTDAAKRGHTLLLAHDLASTSSKAFDKLKPEHSRLLKIHGIDAKQWDVIRQAAKVADDGRTYILPGDIMDVEGAVFTGMSKFQQRRLKEQAKENLFMLYSTEADYSVPTPGAREQAILKQGYRPDTVLGQAIRFFTQFKAFPTTALTKVVGRQFYGGGSNVQMASLIAGSIIMGTMIVQLKELAKGREPREWDMSLFMEGAMQGGALGIYGDFLFQKHNEYGGSAITTAAGPVFNDLSQLWNATQDLYFNGDASNLKKTTVNLLKGYTPGANLFYTKMAMDYLIFYQLQEFVNPGYVARMERNLKNRTGQEYMSLPIFGTPSQTIATGGGFK